MCNSKFIGGFCGLILIASVTTGWAQLTINGTTGSQFIMNVTGDFSFAKSFIRLTGGIRSEDVLFNVQGGSAAFRKPKFALWIGYDF